METLFEILKTLLFYVVFPLSSLLLILVVLLQEGKGGGLADAFGGAGGETFGVRASGIARFTGYVAAAFIGCVVLYHIVSKQLDVQGGEIWPEPPKQEVPVIPGENAVPVDDSKPAEDSQTQDEQEQGEDE